MLSSSRIYLIKIPFYYNNFDRYYINLIRYLNYFSENFVHIENTIY